MANVAYVNRLSTPLDHRVICCILDQRQKAEKIEGRVFLREIAVEQQCIERQFLIYLACAVTGLSFEDATGWYREVEEAFPRHLIAIKPVRGAEYLNRERVLKEKYRKNPLSTQKGIVMRCYHDVDRADGLLVYLLKAKQVSRGSCGEVGRAAWRKPIVVVMKKGNPHWGDPMMHEPAIVVPTLQIGIRTIIGLVSPV